MRAPWHAAPGSITKAELARRLDEPDLRIVDVRPLAAYNGWRLGTEVRGGHIPGASALPSGWLRSVEPDQLCRLLDELGISSAAEVVVYGDPEASARPLVEHLTAQGRARVLVLSCGFPAWSADRRLPVEALARYTDLVHPGWLRTLIDGGQPQAAPASRWLLFHVDFSASEEYAREHLPGALYLDTEWLEEPEAWDRRSPAALEAALAGQGITRDTTVILYGRDIEAHADGRRRGRRAGRMAAARAALILRYAGVPDVRVLDGGYDAWVRAGHEVETLPRLPAPVASTGLVVPERPELIIDLPRAKAILADRDRGALVSVRSWREHIGVVSGYDHIGPAGRIAGDVWVDCGTDAFHMQRYRAVDDAMRPFVEIAAAWRQAGITPDKEVAFYCGTGWRAAEAWFCAYLMGWPSVCVYDGGWLEWSRDPVNNPVEVGIPGDEGIA